VSRTTARLTRVEETAAERYGPPGPDALSDIRTIWCSDDPAEVRAAAKRFGFDDAFASTMIELGAKTRDEQPPAPDVSSQQSNL
jgi:hypothetical protein